MKESMLGVLSVVLSLVIVLLALVLFAFVVGSPPMKWLIENTPIQAALVVTSLMALYGSVGMFLGKKKGLEWYSPTPVGGVFWAFSPPFAIILMVGGYGLLVVYLVAVLA